MRTNKRSGIYCIENTANGRRYIGQSVDVDGRWSKHRSALNRHCHDNRYLQYDWDEYGPDVFDFYVVEYCDANRLDDRERYYIRVCKTSNRYYGYNLQLGGKDHGYPSEETKKKISESNKVAYQNSDLRKQRSDDALKQWSNPEIKSKIMGQNNGMYGRHHTEEARQKIRQAATGRVSPKRLMIPVLCVELNRAFSCAAEAAKEFNVQSSGILGVCRGTRKTIGGYHWTFLSENNI